MSRHVAIIGAGVSGLTCGVAFAERGYRTTIIAEETGLQTTSGAAGAIWFPYDAEPADLIAHWSLATFNVLREMAADATTGVSMIELRCFARNGELRLPDWAGSLGAKLLDSGAADFPACFTSGFALDVPLMDTAIYLEALTQRFAQAGGVIRAGIRLQTAAKIPADHQLIINCSGVGARTLARDAEVEPHRGQVEIVPKLPLPYAVLCDEPPLMYAFPRTNDCVFGGTNERSGDRTPCAEETTSIVAECARVLNFAPPPVLATRVGLRPFRRSGVRLELERLADGRSLIHNYGHGGSGFTLSWGCAEAVLTLANA